VEAVKEQSKSRQLADVLVQYDEIWSTSNNNLQRIVEALQTLGHIEKTERGKRKHSELKTDDSSAG